MIVTSIDAGFLPGLKALHNSILHHSPDTPLACLTYGDFDLADEVSNLGIEVYHNVDINSYLPPGNGTDEGCKPMYARLLAPELFDKCVWMDADQVVQTDMSPLFSMNFDEPIAAVADTHSAQRSVHGLKTGSAGAIMSGLMVFNVAEWRRRKLLDECFRVMSMPNVRFILVVQSVLNVVLNGEFHRLDDSWQGFANRRDINTKHFKVLHWHGRGPKPWTHPDMPHAEIWRQYA